MEESIGVRNGEHHIGLREYFLSGILALAFIASVIGYAVGAISTSPLIVGTVLCWTAALVLWLILDQHNAWVVSLGFLAAGIFLGLLDFSDLPQAIEFGILGFIGMVLIALNVNKLFGTFDAIGLWLVVKHKSFLLLQLSLAIIAGILAFLFDEGSSVGIVALILGRIVAGIMVEISKIDDPYKVNPEELKIAMMLFDLVSFSFVFFTNILAPTLPIGHPVSLAISGYAGWDIGFWLQFVVPLTLSTFAITASLFFWAKRKSYNKLQPFYVGFREYQIAKNKKLTNENKIGLFYLAMMGFLQIGHQSFADMMGVSHTVTLTMFPIIMTVIMVIHRYLIDPHELHGVLHSIPMGEFLNMFGIFLMAHLLSVVGVLSAIGLTIGAVAKGPGGIWILGALSAILSGLLENLGVALAVNTMVDQIFGGVYNTTSIRLSVMMASMYAGNLLIFASVAGLVGIPLFQTYTVSKLYSYADRHDMIHIYDKYISAIRRGTNTVKWLIHSVPIVIISIVWVLGCITAYNALDLYPEGIYYCQYTEAEGCEEGVPGAHGGHGEEDHGDDEEHHEDDAHGGDEESLLPLTSLTMNIPGKYS